MTMAGKDVQQSIHNAHTHRRICVRIQGHVPKRRAALRARKGNKVKKEWKKSGEK